VLHQPNFKTQQGEMFGIQCSTNNCGITTLGPHRKTIDEVINIWNTRKLNEVELDFSK